MRLVSILGLLVATISLCSCSSVMTQVTHKTSVGADKALVTIYYKGSFVNAGPIEVFADDASYGEIAKRTSLQMEVEPGEHVIYARLGRNWGVLDATVEAGKRYFANLIVIPNFFTGPNVSIDPVVAAEGPEQKAKDFAGTTTYAVDPAKLSAWEAKRRGAINRISERHKAGNTKPSKLAAGDGI